MTRLANALREKPAAKAARFYGPKAIEIKAMPVPVLCPGAVMIDIAWCGICGTDLHEFLEGPTLIPATGHPHPLTRMEEPVTLGQEFSGTVSARAEEAISMSTIAVGITDGPVGKAGVGVHAVAGVVREYLKERKQP